MDAEIQALAEALRAALGDDAVAEGQPLARFTSLRVGGPADLTVRAASGQALQAAVRLAWQHGTPCRVLGGGSNVLIADAGLRGVVVVNRARAVTVAPSSVRAESGASLSTVARQCLARGLAGLEWATGIPGSIGGAVVGNAGAWGGDVASVLAWASILREDGAVEDWTVERLEYRYRGSTLKRRGATAGSGRRPVVLEAEFWLRPADRQELQARVAEVTARRKASQPPGATCGSVFQNPPGDYAGRLVEAAGLKGRRQGGATISTRHANFVVNEGSATAADIRVLIDLARHEVQARFGVELELEIEMLGEWGGVVLKN